MAADLIRLHDHERTPEDRLTCQWGALASLGSSIASGAGTAASAAGTAVGNAGTALAQNSGISSLYNAGSNLLSSGGGEAGYIQSLNPNGPPVEAGVELAGMHPSMVDSGPGFLHGFAQGMSGALGQYAEPTAGTQFGQGLGMLGNFLDSARGMGAQMNAGSLLRSALGNYTGMSDGGVRPYAGGPSVGPQKGLLSFDLFGHTGTARR